MVFNVARLLMESSGSTRQYQLDERISLVEDAEEQKVSGRVKLLRTTKSIWISAELTSAVDSECWRCLTEFCQPIKTGIEEEALPVLNPVTGIRIHPSEFGCEYLYIDDKHNLDLSETLREYASMAVPMNPVCRPDCAGLCHKCGANLNQLSCVCEKVSLDPRWGALLEATATVPDLGR